jgi:hypothetical protein
MNMENNQLALNEKLNKMALPNEYSKTILDQFGDLFVEAHKLVAAGKGIVVTSEDQVELMAQAKEIRQQLARIRVEAEKAKVAIKEPFLRAGNAVQDIFNDIRDITKPEEIRLKEQEKFAEIAEIKRTEAKHAQRVQSLSRYVDDVSVYNLRDMPDNTFESLLSDCKNAYEAKVEAIRKEEEQKKITKEKYDILVARQFELAQYTHFRNEATSQLTKLGIDTSETDFQFMLGTYKKAQVEWETKQKKIQEENDRLKVEQEKKQAEADKLIAEEKAKAQEAQRKLDEAQEREREAKRVAEEKKRLDEEEARAKLLAPDKNKMADFANTIDKIALPAVVSFEAQLIIKEAEEMLTKVSNYIREKSKGL